MEEYSTRNMRAEKTKYVKSMDPPIPEPRHRVGPQGVSSGVSFRKLPPPSLCAIRKICEHYEAKCSGQYSSLASRYVFQMGQEIKAQIEGLENEAQSYLKPRNKTGNVDIPEGDCHCEDCRNGDGKRNGNCQKQTCYTKMFKDEVARLRREAHILEESLHNSRKDLEETKRRAHKDMEIYTKTLRENSEAELMRQQRMNYDMRVKYEGQLKEVKEELAQVKKDAKLVVQFIRKRAKDTIAEAMEKAEADKMNIIRKRNISEERMKHDLVTHLQRLEKRVRESSADKGESSQGACEPMKRKQQNEQQYQNVSSMPTKDAQKTSSDDLKAAAFLRNNDFGLESEDSTIASLDDYLAHNNSENSCEKKYHSRPNCDRTTFHPPHPIMKEMDKEEECERLKSRVRDLEQWVSTVTMALRNSDASVKKECREGEANLWRAQKDSGKMWMGCTM